MKMGGSAVYDEWEFTSSSDEVRTVVLVGKTGNGKSATGNSILRTKKFDSKFSSGGVTRTCELHSTVLDDGKILNVIDTPGLFDADREFIGTEIVNCINMAKDGIHAVILVLSIRSRFSQEEEAAVESLSRLFSSKLSTYMILVFTNGDALGNGATLNDYLGGRDCPHPLKETLKMCGNRCVLFDNETKDEHQKNEQLGKLLALVNDVIDNNGGKPYTDEIFAEMKVVPKSQFTEQFHKSYEEHLKRITEMVELKLKVTTDRLEKQLAKERIARLESEAAASERIRQLSADLERAQKETEELRSRCIIL